LHETRNFTVRSEEFDEGMRNGMVWRGGKANCSRVKKKGRDSREKTTNNPLTTTTTTKKH